jgi:hypothetical protein
MILWRVSRRGLSKTGEATRAIWISSLWGRAVCSERSVTRRGRNPSRAKDSKIAESTSSEESTTNILLISSIAPPDDDILTKYLEISKKYFLLIIKKGFDIFRPESERDAPRLWALEKRQDPLSCILLSRGI